MQSPAFYLHKLGVNAVELQPVQEFDNKTREEYHWGYMTNNFFAPESSYSLDPAHASGVRELQELVRAFHRRGIAVLLDVVFNHVGEPAHLMFIDKLYYFEQDDDGKLANWSGCGNDLRARSAMSTRLIIDSCLHAIEAYGVDGFRFDLADLIGVDVLREVEASLKCVKPDVVLISEPWSFRGHIAGALRDTGWASWNDGYRKFMGEFVRGGGTHEGFEYFLKGSPWHFSKWPAQTVNYTESHDDRTWMDIITENADYNGFSPTANDRRRTHLMAAILFASIGIPMISSGQDFLQLRSQRGEQYLPAGRSQRPRLPPALSFSLHACVFCRLDRLSPQRTRPSAAALFTAGRDVLPVFLRRRFERRRGDLQCRPQPWPAAPAFRRQSHAQRRRHPARRSGRVRRCVAATRRP